MVRMIAGKLRRYGTRMLQAGDEFEVQNDRQRRLLIGARLATEAPAKAKRPHLDHDKNGKEGGSKSAEGDLTALRAEYTEKVGKRPFNGWDAAELRERMKAAD